MRKRESGGVHVRESDCACVGTLTKSWLVEQECLGNGLEAFGNLLIIRWITLNMDNEIFKTPA